MLGNQRRTGIPGCTVGNLSGNDPILTANLRQDVIHTHTLFFILTSYPRSPCARLFLSHDTVSTPCPNSLANTTPDCPKQHRPMPVRAAPKTPSSHVAHGIHGPLTRLDLISVGKDFTVYRLD